MINVNIDFWLQKKLGENWHEYFFSLIIKIKKGNFFYKIEHS